MRPAPPKSNEGPDSARQSGTRPAVSPFPELRGKDEQPASGARARPAANDSNPAIDLSMELAQLRQASPLVDKLEDSPFKSAVRFVLRSFGVQLAIFVLVSIAAVLVPALVSRTLDMRLEPGPFAYFVYYLLATLFFTRHRYKESFTALFVILAVAIGLHVAHLYPGFRPTTYFWFTLLVVGTVNAFYFNDYTVTIAEQNLELRQLRKDMMASDRLMRVSPKGGQDEMAFVKRAQDEVAQTRAHYTSLIANLMQFGGAGAEGKGSQSGTNYTVIARSIWQLLKRGVGATRAEILFLDQSRGVLYIVKAFVTAEKAAEGPFGFSAAPSEEIPAEKAKLTIPLDKDSLFKACIGQKRTILRNDIDRERPLQELEQKTPCPVHSLIPLIDGETVLGVINISECPKKELSDEDKTIVRTTARLGAMALAHAQTFLQTKEELEAAKVLSDVERKKRAEVLKVFKTLVSANIVEEILNDPSVMNPKRQRITIIFVDLRGFTTLSEQLDAAVVVELLDDFFETLTPLIFKYGGTLDKYIGDEIMALWGAPFAKPDDTRNAILCSVEMMQAMESVKARWRPRGLDVAMGIAINTGEAIVGSIGSSANKNFTAIGDAVNTCARLEGLSERNQILMTRETYDDVRDIVKVKQLESQHVKGKERMLEIYEVLGLKLDGAREVSLPRAAVVELEAAPARPPTAPGKVKPEPPRPAPAPAMGSRPGAVHRAVPAAAPEPAPEQAAGGIVSSRDLASRVAARPAGKTASTVPEQVDGVACPRCRHVNTKPGLKRCDKCGESLVKA